MKKITLFFVVALISGALFAENFKIKGTVTDLQTGTVRLKILQNDGTLKLDSTLLNKGKFEFSGKVEGACPAIVSVQQNPTGAVFYLENSTIELSMKSVAEKSANPYSVKITGSKSNDAYVKFTADCDTAKKKLECYYELVKENPTSIYAPFIIVQYRLINAMKYEQLKPVMDAMGNEAKNTYAYKVDLEGKLKDMERVIVGKKAPALEFPDSNGNKQNFTQLLEKNNYVLIDFWASWCGPCRKENPNVVAAYKAYHDKGFDVFGVSFDKDKARWLKAVNDDKLEWTQVMDLNGMISSRLYAISGIPSNALIDKNGIIVARDIKGEDLHTKLKELLGEPKE